MFVKSDEENTDQNYQAIYSESGESAYRPSGMVSDEHTLFVAIEVIEELKPFIRELETELGCFLSLGIENEVNDEFTLDCIECNKTFTSKRYYTQHMNKVHETSEPHKCPNCDYQTLDKDCLRAHARSVHGLAELLELGVKIYNCSKCKHRTGSIKGIRNHTARKHGGTDCWKVTYKTKAQKVNDLEGHLCNICGKLWKTKKSLTRHTNEVHAQTLHCCEICSYKTKRKYELKTHFETAHSRSEVVKVKMSFTCDQCGSRFNYKQSLNDHIQRIHEDKMFVCSVCEFETNSHQKLIKHQLCHKGVVHSCEHCRETFDTRDALYKHVARTHKSDRVKRSYKKRVSKKISKVLLPRPPE